MGKKYCPICLEPTGFNDILRCPKQCNDVLLKCGHVFHRTCIKKWIIKQDTCPCCREKTRFNEGGYFKLFILLFELYRISKDNVICFPDGDEDSLYIYYDYTWSEDFINEPKINRLHYVASSFFEYNLRSC